MRATFLICLTLILCASLKAQNIIANYDFSTMNFSWGQPQSTINPPCIPYRGGGCRQCAEYWNVSGNSHGYNNICDTSLFGPGNGIFPNPLLGTGYFIMWLFGINKQTNEAGGYSVLTHYLQSQLSKDSSYTLEFYARAEPRASHLWNLWNPNHTPSSGFVNKLGVSFSDTITYRPLGSGSNETMLLFPEPYDLHDSTPAAFWQGDFITLNEWHRVSMNFIATGEEKYMHIHYFDFDSTDVLEVYNHPTGIHITLLFDAFALYKSSDTLYSVSIGNDTLLCPGEELTLTANLDDGFKLEDSVTTFLWSTGDTVPQITVNSPGTYWVEVTINHRFKQRDSIVVEYEEPIVWHAPFGESETIEKCYEVLPWAVSGPETSHDAVYLWSTGENTQSIEIRHEDVYRLRIITPCFDEEGEFYFKPIDCNMDSSAFRGNIYIPTAFTPQGRNPLWIIGGIPPNTRVEVYSRWGQRIFYSEDYLHNWWDGTINGQPVPPGSYTYRIIAPFEGQEVVDKTGTVTIVR
jgi:gliding motility-associated-like protein